MKDAYISKNENTFKTKTILKGPTSPESFIERQIIFIQHFVTEIFGFKIFADISTNDCL